MTTPERSTWARAAFVTRAGSLTKSELLALGTAVEALVAEGGDAERLTKGFFFAWYKGPSLSSDDNAALNDLFIDVVVAIARSITDVDPWAMTAGRPSGQRPGFAAAFLELFTRKTRDGEVESFAIRLVERAVAPVDPRVALVAAWNASCAVALHGRLDPPVEETLGAAWRRAIGDLPA
ncbi:MAG: hypothetical protein WCH74_00585 [Chloroflexota bacterium]